MSRAVDDDGLVARLPGEARAATARQHRHAVLATDRDGRHDRIDGARHDDADRRVPVVRRIGRVQRARPAVEAHLSVDVLAQRALERRAFAIAYVAPQLYQLRPHAGPPRRGATSGPGPVAVDRTRSRHAE